MRYPPHLVTEDCSHPGWVPSQWDPASRIQQREKHGGNTVTDFCHGKHCTFELHLLRCAKIASILSIYIIYIYTYIYIYIYYIYQKERNTEEQRGNTVWDFCHGKHCTFELHLFRCAKIAPIIYMYVYICIYIYIYLYIYIRRRAQSYSDILLIIVFIWTIRVAALQNIIRNKIVNILIFFDHRCVPNDYDRIPLSISLLYACRGMLRDSVVLRIKSGCQESRGVAPVIDHVTLWAAVWPQGLISSDRYRVIRIKNI